MIQVEGLPRKAARTSEMLKSKTMYLKCRPVRRHFLFMHVCTMAYKPNDFYARKAKSENFVARSVYKLEEIDKKYRILKKGHQVFDLGAAPGSWSQYASSVIGESGKILGVDLKPVSVSLSNAVFLTGDIQETDLKTIIAAYGFKEKFDVVISDMAPSTSSNRFTDQARSFDLCQTALLTAVRFLKKGGAFICKIFDGPDARIFGNEMKAHFRQVHAYRPKSTQKSSKEFFYIGTGFLA